MIFDAPGAQSPGAFYAPGMKDYGGICGGCGILDESRHHPFNGWFDIAPIRGLVLATP